MMDKLSSAEEELKRKKAEADSDMMMAGMVRPAPDTAECLYKYIVYQFYQDVSCPAGIRQR